MHTLLREYLKLALVAEAYSVGGFAYEKKIQAILARSGAGPKKLTAGAGHGADATFFGPDGKEYQLEVKDSPNVFAGQKNCFYDGNTLKWSTPDDLTMLYDEINLRDTVLEKVQSKLDDAMVKLGISALPSSMTNAQYWSVRNKSSDLALELGTFRVEPKAIYQNYIMKDVHYIQLGDGYGFYFLDKDPANLGVPQFSPLNVSVRVRIKWGGSSAGVKGTPSYDLKKARSAVVAQDRNGLSLNVGLIFKGLSPSPQDIEKDPSFLSSGTVKHPRRSLR